MKALQVPRVTWLIKLKWARSQRCWIERKSKSSWPTWSATGLLPRDRLMTLRTAHFAIFHGAQWRIMNRSAGLRLSRHIKRHYRSQDRGGESKCHLEFNLGHSASPLPSPAVKQNCYISPDSTRKIRKRRGLNLQACSAFHSPSTSKSIEETYQQFFFWCLSKPLFLFNVLTRG